MSNPRITFEVADYIDEDRTVGRLERYQRQHDCAAATTTTSNLVTAADIADGDEVYLSVGDGELSYALVEPSGRPVTALDPARVELAVEELPDGAIEVVVAHHGPVVLDESVVVAPRTPTKWDEHDDLDDRDAIVEAMS